MTTHEHGEPMPCRPDADHFPLLSGEELAALAADVKEHGLYSPIYTGDGRIVDGRNRHLAFLLAGVRSSGAPPWSGW